MNSQVMAEKITQALVDEVQNNVSVDKSGLAVLGDKTSSAQRLMVSDKTRMSIRNELGPRRSHVAVRSVIATQDQYLRQPDGRRVTGHNERVHAPPLSGVRRTAAVDLQRFLCGGPPVVRPAGGTRRR